MDHSKIQPGELFTVSLSDARNIEEFEKIVPPGSNLRPNEYIQAFTVLEKNYCANIVQVIYPERSADGKTFFIMRKL